MKISIILDFVCPYCYISEKVMWKALDDHPDTIEFEWLPYELNPEPSPLKQVPIEKKIYFEKNIIPLAKNENISINFPTISPTPRTNIIFEGLNIAKEFKKEIGYIKKVMDSYWIENKNIGDIEILSEIAKEIGIEKNYFKSCLKNEKYKILHKKLNEEISKRDFEVVPTFYINDKQVEKFPVTVREWKNLI